MARTLPSAVSSGVAFTDLGFAYRRGSWVLRGCSGSIGAGEVLAVLGPNGCGKSTLLKLLLGSLKPAEGDVRLDGRPGFVPQLFEPSFSYRVLDMVLMGRARHVGVFAQPTPRDEAAAREALHRLAIAHLAERPFGELSGGQRQLVVLARALAAEAEVLILDEPTSALDLRNQEVVLSWIARLAKDGLSIVFTTHQPNHAAAVADHALLMLGPGHTVLGPTEEALTETRLRELYGVDLRIVYVDAGGRRRTLFAPVYDLGTLPFQPPQRSTR